MVLFDRAAKRIVGKIATKLIAGRIDDQASLKEYSDEFKAINEKKLTLMIELNEDNILLKSTMYIATDAFDSKITGSSKFEATTSELEVTGSKNVSLRSFG
ncbi:hypothetical protein DCAR_0831158 [Daucus carota subsp. sativus]|uniref:Uncharacterized protein n=1 Tax=Daucus carota subsp. sativus TaxID=79200 RepID=A0A175YKR9_DAUCS|nr:hypothetical protein DCAR_0831158 [Daucus carota subsp. sativus]